LVRANSLRENGAMTPQQEIKQPFLMKLFLMQNFLI
jgi:hypothetical protein